MGSPEGRLIRLWYPERFRLVPQWDEEIRGYRAAFEIQKTYDHVRSLPIAVTLPSVYCDDCETTWLVGNDGPQSARHHPWHNTLFHKNSGKSKRSMIVHVFGAYPGDVATSGKSSAGVFFGRGSSYNINHILPTPGPTKEIAEIMAATAAVRRVREMVRPNREVAIRQQEVQEGIHVEARWPDGWTTPHLELRRDSWIFRLIVVTDSKYLVECLCEHRRGWQLTPNRAGCQDHMGALIPNGHLFVDLLREIDILAGHGVEVM